MISCRRKNAFIVHARIEGCGSTSGLGASAFDGRRAESLPLISILSLALANCRRRKFTRARRIHSLLTSARLNEILDKTGSSDGRRMSGEIFSLRSEKMD